MKIHSCAEAPAGVVVSRVRQGSAAAAAGVCGGDRLLAVNGAPLRDVIDFHFNAGEEELRVELERAGVRTAARLVRRRGRALGLEFETPRPAEISTCANKCVFCFIHQLPRGMRRSLYVKDDDYRLSFLHGNALPLTALDEAELDRIETQRLSPLYVSVHATDPALRHELLGRPRVATPILPVMARLARAGISMHAQIVLCPGVNDGAQLARTVFDLSALHPGVRGFPGARRRDRPRPARRGRFPAGEPPAPRAAPAASHDHGRERRDVRPAARRPARGPRGGRAHGRRGGGAERLLRAEDRGGRTPHGPGHPARAGPPPARRARADPRRDPPGAGRRLPGRPDARGPRARPRRPGPGGRADAAGAPPGPGRRMRRAGAASGTRSRRPASSESVRPPEAVGAGASVVRPVVAIVGRPNVGKSTLFNRLVGRRQALVRDVPGVTRDRLYGLVAFDRWQATFVDTGGFDPSPEASLVDGVRRQVLAALAEADLVLFVVDARAGLTGLDREIADA